MAVFPFLNLHGLPLQCVLPMGTVESHLWILCKTLFNTFHTTYCSFHFSYTHCLYFIELVSMVSMFTFHPSSLQAERFLVELRYLMAVLGMYFSTFRRTPTTILSQLFGCLQDKINVTAPVPLSGTSILFIDQFCLFDVMSMFLFVLRCL